MAPEGVDERAVKTMTEAGIDISGRVSKSIDAFGNLAFDYVITHCDKDREACPIFPAKTMVLHVGFHAPPRPAAKARKEETMAPYRKRGMRLRNSWKHFRTYKKELPHDS